MKISRKKGILIVILLFVNFIILTKYNLRTMTHYEHLQRKKSTSISQRGNAGTGDENLLEDTVFKYRQEKIKDENEENNQEGLSGTNEENSHEAEDMNMHRETYKEEKEDVGAKDKKRLRFMEKIVGKIMDHSGENCTKTLPQAIIIGVMKSGTETFATFLSIHPDIAMQFKVRAVLFFNNNYWKGIEWYKNQMPCSKRGQITMEKSPQYFFPKYVPERVYKTNSSIKLIVVVREPVSRSVSHFSHLQDVNPGTIPKSFEETVLNKDGEIDEDNVIISSSLYGPDLERWLDYFSLDQIHIVDGDKFQKFPVQELKRTEEFLGLRPFINDDHFVYKEEKGFYCIKATAERGCMPKGKGRKHPNIDEDFLRKLKEFFKPFNEKFFKLAERRFDW